MCHISRSATEAPALDNLQLALLALVRTSIRQPMVCCPPNRAGAYRKKCAARLNHRLVGVFSQRKSGAQWSIQIGAFEVCSERPHCVESGLSGHATGQSPL